MIPDSPDDPFTPPRSALSAGISPNFTAVMVFAVLNTVFSVLSFLGAGFFVLGLIYGVLYSNDPREEIVVGIIGCGLFIGFFMFAAVLCEDGHVVSRSSLAAPHSKCAMFRPGSASSLCPVRSAAIRLARIDLRAGDHRFRVHRASLLQGRAPRPPS